MNYIEIMENRWSVRNFSKKDVEREKIERAVRAAGLSPSACNSQPWEFIVVDDKELKEKVARMTFSRIVSFNEFVKDAPVIVVVVTSRGNFPAILGGKLKKKNFSLIDTGIAVSNFCNCAFAEGIGTCILGWFDEKGLKKMLEIPSGKRVYVAIALGYPAEEKEVVKDRKELEDIISYNKYEY